MLYGVPLSPLKSGMAGAETLKMGDIVILWKNVGDIVIYISIWML
jgi:hypothetical protein